MSYNWNRLFAGYQKTRGGAYMGFQRDTNDCQLVLSEGEKSPVLICIDTERAGKYGTMNNIYARTCVQLNGVYHLKMGGQNAVVGGVKGLMSAVTGGTDYGYPDVTRNRTISTNDKDFTKRVLGDLDFRNALLRRKEDAVTILPTPQGDGWHMVEVRDNNFDGGMAGGSLWVSDAVAADTQFMEPEEKARIEQAAQTYFDTQMDEFLTLLRTAARAVTAWRM